MRAELNEPVVVRREVEAIVVPAGTPARLTTGMAGYITQALGGSFTLYIDGNLYRLPGEQADAIGKEVSPAPQLPPGATEEDLRSLAWEQLRGCYDPEIPINIVDLGLVYELRVEPCEQGGRDVFITLTLTAPGCGMGEVLVQEVRERIGAIPTVRDVQVQLSFDPPWDRSMMSEAARLQTGMTW